MPEPSTIYFPLASNASALFAGPGVAGVRRRILAAALLHDQVVLEDGLHTTWAGPGGSSSMTARGASDLRWQTPVARGRATGSRHYLAMRPDSAPESTPFHAMISTEADFSWHATFEPFRAELPASAAKWLAFGHVEGDRPAKEMVGVWESSDRLGRLRQGGSRPTAARERFAQDAILKAGYLDLAIAATAGSAISIDRRHRLAIEARLTVGDAAPVGGHYALHLLLPVEFTWDDVADLRRHRALREYRAVMREIEDEAMRTSQSPAELDDHIHREYANRVALASARGLPFTGRVALAAVGFILGAIAEPVAPVVGGGAATAATFVAGEGLNRAIKPRWLSVDRRIQGRRNGM